jgi:hypothetical protein
MVCWRGGKMKIQYNFTKKEIELIIYILEKVNLSSLDSESLRKVMFLLDNLVSVLNLESDLNEVEQ